MFDLTEKPRIIVICGPTGIGKTTSAIALARKINGEIISADSVQIYRYMDIGTAKPTSDEQRAVPHHMIDIVDPDESFDAGLFAEKAGKDIFNLVGRGIVPIVVGGTGFYVKALLQGLFEADPVSEDTRNRLRTEREQKGLKALYRRLEEVDPETAKTLHPNDQYRIFRALEVYESTGQPISRKRSAHGFSHQPYNALKIGLHMDRQRLYERINRRVDIMIGQGLVNEAKELLAKGYSKNLKSMQTIGYRHIIQYLEGNVSWAETLRTMKRDTRRYAKRQFTWFGKDPDICWVSPTDHRSIHRLSKAFLGF